MPGARRYDLHGRQGIDGNKVHFPPNQGRQGRRQVVESAIDPHIDLWPAQVVERVRGQPYELSVHDLDEPEWPGADRNRTVSASIFSTRTGWPRKL